MASAFLHRTMDRTADSGYAKKWVCSTWLKISKLGVLENKGLFSIQKGSTSNSRVNVGFNSTDNLWVETKDSTGTDDAFKQTKMKFRDTSAWYHIYIKYDSTLGTAADRLVIFVNGVEQTYDNVNEVGSNFGILMDSSVDFRVGIYRTNGGAIRYMDGQYAHFYFINYEDGATPDPYTDFGETDATTGIWKPILSPSITYGDQSVFLKFDNSGNMGLDSSGQGNNLSTSGTVIQNKDTPTNNFAKLNFNDIAGTNSIELANTGTTTMQTSNVGDYGIRSTLAATTGKYYWEAKIATSNTICILPTETRLVINLSDGSPASDLYGVQRYSDTTTNIYDDGTFDQQNTAMWGGITSSDIISFALDLTNGKLFVAKNGAYKNQSGATGDPVNGTNPTFTISDTTKTYTFYTEMRGNDNNGTLVNFGDGYFGTTAVSSAQNPDDGIGIFEYDPPAGYKAWTTKAINSQEYS